MTSRPQQEQTPAPQTCVSRETAAPHFIAPPLAPQATEAAPRTARTTAQIQVRTRYHPRIVSRETFGTCAYRRAHPQTRNHALNHRYQQAGCHPSAAPRSITHAHLHRAHSRRAAHAQRPTPAAPHTHTRSARRDLPPQSPAATHPRRPASPPPLTQAPREDPVPRREDPCEYEARGEHQDDRGARGHVQRPREVQADEPTRSTQHG